MATLTSLLHDIDASTRDLTEVLWRYGVHDSCRYFAIPPVLAEKEQDIIDNDFATITSTKLTGAQALHKCFYAYKDLTVEDDRYSRRFVNKHPGFIVVSDIDEVMPKVKALNDAKQKFEEAAVAIAEEDRHEEIHKARNYLITMAAYRKVYAFDYPVKAAYFNFTARPIVSFFATVRDVEEKLNKMKRSVPKNTTEYAWCQKLNSIIERLYSEFGNCTFSTRRRAKVYPEVCIKDGDGQKRSYTAGLPVIIGNVPAKVSDLGDYDANNRRKPNHSAGNEWLCIEPSIKLFAKHA